MRALLALLALGACADAPAEPTLQVRGVYIESVFDGEAMRVDHEAIPGRMPAMDMAFRVDAPALIRELAAGDRVRLTLDSASLRVVGVETLPAGTVLELATDDPGGIVLPSE